MILKSIGPVLFIEDAGKIKDGYLIVEVKDIPDGTALCIQRATDLKYAVADLNNSRAMFKGDFFTDGDYTVSYEDTEGRKLYRRFAVNNGQLKIIYRGVEAELADMWRAISYIESLVAADDEKITEVIDGFVTE